MINVFWFYFASVRITSLLIVMTFLLRFLLRRQSRVITNLLWFFLLLRLLCPFTIKVDFGMIPQDVNGVLFIEKEELNETGHTQISRNDGVGKIISETENPVSEQDKNILDALPVIWVCGMVVFACVIGLYHLILYRKKRYAVRIPKRLHVYEWPDFTGACVLGLFRPRIYVPTGLSEELLDNVLLHERMHIKRGDHIIVVLNRLALCLNWFNPLCWLAYFQYRKDMELACDEQVVRHQGVTMRRNYANALLSLGVTDWEKEAPAISFNKGKLKKRIIHIGREHKIKLNVVIGVVLINIAMFSSAVFVNAAKSELEAVKRELSENSQIFTNLELCYTDMHQVVFYNQHGVFVYDMDQRELCGYESFQDKDLSIYGEDKTDVYSLIDGTELYLVTKKSGICYRYSLADATLTKGDYDITDISIWEPDIDTAYDKESDSLYIYGDVFRWADGTRYYFATDQDEPEYSDLCFVVTDGEKQERYYIFR